VHHPIASALYYEDQKAEAKRRAADFAANRLPKYLGYFEDILKNNPRSSHYLLGESLLRRSLDFPDDRRLALRLPAGHGSARTQAPATRGFARSHRGAPPARDLSRFAAPHPV
jgi:hypothetical protein